mmetsp:Transcript_23043/g.53871  ORF Transcript_23043/g.53871 Transcript_23043/m.53871 type:complete len:391 (+) Transcript_23043:152-1324(+)
MSLDGSESLPSGRSSVDEDSDRRSSSLSIDERDASLCSELLRARIEAGLDSDFLFSVFSHAVHEWAESRSGTCQRLVEQCRLDWESALRMSSTSSFLVSAPLSAKALLRAEQALSRGPADEGADCAFGARAFVVRAGDSYQTVAVAGNELFAVCDLRSRTMRVSIFDFHFAHELGDSEDLVNSEDGVSELVSRCLHQFQTAKEKQLLIPFDTISRLCFWRPPISALQNPAGALLVLDLARMPSAIERTLKPDGIARAAPCEKENIVPGSDHYRTFRLQIGGDLSDLERLVALVTAADSRIGSLYEHSRTHSLPPACRTASTETVPIDRLWDGPPAQQQHDAPQEPPPAEPTSSKRQLSIRNTAACRLATAAAKPLAPAVAWCRGLGARLL